MKTLKIVFVVLVTLAVVVTTGFFLIGYLKPKPGGLMVVTTPTSSVYINGKLMGKSPYKGTDTAGQINLKLIPDVSDQSLIPYETKVNLVAGIQTIVRREFGTTEDASSGDVISFDKQSGNLSGLVVVSNPDNSQIFVDGVAQGFSPYNLNSVATGSHQITVKAAGFLDRTMDVKTQTGYKLTVFAKLAKTSEVEPTPTLEPSPIQTSKTYILIKDTPTGFLRMRTEPGAKGEEIAELKPGGKYLFLEADITSGWFKIQYQDSAPGLPNGIVGWVSNQYAEISTESATLK
ncbi:MAG TPA: PEGA domain-containing protein [Patescibacteria group bacterium]|nr:PEGA domain-containing protein [Patescibacteria group bacterium]